MRIRLSEQSLEWLYDNRIFFLGFKAHGHRLRPGMFLQWREGAAIEPYVAIYKGDVIPKIGSFTYVHSAVPADFTFGRYCSVSWDVKFPGPRHPMELLSTGGFMLETAADIWSTFLADTNSVFKNAQPNPQKHGTVIGHDVWIGQDVSIMRGLQIGDGSVIASGAIVTKDVEPYAIVGGNPAKFIRWRFPQDIRDELAELRWWRYAFPALNKIDLSNIKNSIRDLREKCADMPEFTPTPIPMAEMPHNGVV
jgi:acetyltransferase-like isoleucine patch superfamily enzyme